VNLAGTVSDEHGMDEEAAAQSKMLASLDFSEAISAFVERRAAAFTGR
jgi:hypothetical protein